MVNTMNKIESGTFDRRMPVACIRFWRICGRDLGRL